MSNEMIERVHKALSASLMAHGINGDELAKAAIRAMREPTKEMISCAESQFALFADEYRRAIDAALKE